MTKKILAAAVVAAMTMMLLGMPAEANHSWGTYHWARTANPFTLKLGDNVNANWDAYLNEASSDWTKSSVLNTTVVAGMAGNVKRCAPQSGRVEVCNASYGNNGWLGIAAIYISGGHITAGYVKLNDTYFNSSSYNKPEWRRLVACQEIGHTFGLDHQDENFSNPNLGTCMDYTNSPLGLPSNEHPNQHDYDQLGTIYSHLDSSTTVGQGTGGTGKGKSRSRIDEVDKNGNGTVTFILWAE